MTTLMKIFVTMVVVVFGVVNSNAQVESKRYIDDNRLMITGGVNLHQNIMGEIGVMYGGAVEYGDFHFPFGFQGMRLTSEFTTDRNNLIIGPKISYEYVYVLGGFRIGMIDYRQSNKNDFRFVPEIGISYAGFIDLFYGVNIPIGYERISTISFSRLSLVINLDFLRFNEFYL